MKALGVAMWVFVMVNTALFWFTRLFADPAMLRALWPVALSWLLALAFRDWRAPITWSRVRGPQPRQTGWRTITMALIVATGHFWFVVLWSRAQHNQTLWLYSLVTTGFLLVVWGITLERADRRNRRFGDQPTVAGAIQDGAPHRDHQRHSGLQDA